MNHGEADDERDAPGSGALLAAALIWPLTHLVFQLFSLALSHPYAYLAGTVFYWLTIAVLSALLLRRSGLVAIFRRPRLRSTVDRVAVGLCLAMTLAPLFVAFVPSVDKLLLAGWLLLVAGAVINGVLEEVFWRGVFVHRYGDDLWRAFLLPTVFFTLWHCTLIAVRGMRYHGGGAALVGGALGLGLICGFIAWRTRSVIIPVIAHVLLNLFAFAELIADNWP